MTDQVVALTNIGAVVDFTDGNLSVYHSAPVHDGNERVFIANQYALWAGNTNMENKLVFAGQGNDVTPIFNRVDQAVANIFKLQSYILLGYYSEDVSMDGRVIFAGQNNDVTPIFNNTDGYPGNIFKLQSYVLPEQLAQ
jgi:hypothetical protein